MCQKPLSIPPEACPKPCHEIEASDEDTVMDKLLESDLTAIVPEGVLPLVPFAKRSPTYLRVLVPPSSTIKPRSLQYRRLAGGLFGF